MLIARDPYGLRAFHLPVCYPITCTRQYMNTLPPRSSTITTDKPSRDEIWKLAAKTPSQATFTQWHDSLHCCYVLHNQCHCHYRTKEVRKKYQLYWPGHVVAAAGVLGWHITWYPKFVILGQSLQRVLIDRVP